MFTRSLTLDTYMTVKIENFKDIKLKCAAVRVLSTHKNFFTASHSLNWSCVNKVQMNVNITLGAYLLMIDIYWLWFIARIAEQWKYASVKMVFILIFQCLEKFYNKFQYIPILFRSNHFNTECWAFKLFWIRLLFRRTVKTFSTRTLRSDWWSICYHSHFWTIPTLDVLVKVAGNFCYLVDCYEVLPSINQVFHEKFSTLILYTWLSTLWGI